MMRHRKIQSYGVVQVVRKHFWSTKLATVILSLSLFFILPFENGKSKVGTLDKYKKAIEFGVQNLSLGVPQAQAGTRKYRMVGAKRHHGLRIKRRLNKIRITIPGPNHRNIATNGPQYHGPRIIDVRKFLSKRAANEATVLGKDGRWTIKRVQGPTRDRLIVQNEPQCSKGGTCITRLGVKKSSPKIIVLGKPNLTAEAFPQIIYPPAY